MNLHTGLGRVGARFFGPRCGRVVVVMVLGFSACQRDPLDRTVAAESARALAIWQAHLASDSSPELRRRVEEAVQEVRLKIAGDREIKRAMGERVPPGTAEIDETLRKKIHDRPLREVLQLGYELRVQRLQSELAGLEDAMNKNAQLVTRPGDLASKHHLDGLRERQMARLEKYREDLKQAEQELAPLMKASGKVLVPTAVASDQLDVQPERVKKSE